MNSVILRSTGQNISLACLSFQQIVCRNDRAYDVKNVHPTSVEYLVDAPLKEINAWIAAAKTSGIILEAEVKQGKQAYQQYLDSQKG